MCDTLGISSTEKEDDGCGEVGSSVVAYAHETHTWKGVVQALDDTVGKGDCCQVNLIPRTHIGGES